MENQVQSIKICLKSLPTDCIKLCFCIHFFFSGVGEPGPSGPPGEKGEPGSFVPTSGMCLSLYKPGYFIHCIIDIS